MTASAIETTTNILLVNLDQQGRTSLLQIDNYLDQPGKTVAFYGRNLNINYILTEYLSEQNILKLKTTENSAINSTEIQAQTAENSIENMGTDYFASTNTITSTYLLMATNVNGVIMLSYHSFTYDQIADNDMSYFFEEALNTANISNLANEFAGQKQQNAMTRGTVVQDVRDTNTYFDYYKPTGMTTSYLMKMYQKNITYQATKVNDTVSDYDYYYIIPFVKITPGNSLSQQYPQYKNALVVIGAQTDINRKYSVDSLIDGTPNNTTVETMKPKNYSYSLSAGSDGTIGIGFSWTPTNNITRTTTFSDSYFNNFYGGQDSSRKWCISTTEFSYRMGAYLRSYGSYFAFDVNTQVKTLFQNQSLSSAKWSGNPFTLSYQA